MIVYYSTYLSHHGILGQKWGVRRFQNKDGSLTSEGRQRYNELKDRVIASTGSRKTHYGPEEDEEMYEADRKRNGIKSVNEDTDTIAKGATFQRIATFGEPVDEKRKYVSILTEDKRTYESMGDGLPVGDPDKIATIQYQATKQIKVATLKKSQEVMQEIIGDDKISKYSLDIIQDYGKKEAKKILNKYGDMTLKDLGFDNDLLYEMEYNENNTFSKKEQKENSWLKERLEVGKVLVDRASNDIAVGHDTAREDTFYKRMKDLGYDAFVDPLDASTGAADYPLVLVNPKGSVKKTKESRWYEDEAEEEDDDE